MWYQAKVWVGRLFKQQDKEARNIGYERNDVRFIFNLDITCGWLLNRMETEEEMKDFLENKIPTSVRNKFEHQVLHIEIRDAIMWHIFYRIKCIL